MENIDNSKKGSCPCLHLDKPCYNGYCTCVNTISSLGCQNCCTYGSSEQKKFRAEVINKAVNEAREKALTELAELGQKYNI